MVEKTGILFLGVILQVLVICSCTNERKNSSSGSMKSLESGKQLAETYCSGCHSLPSPQLLDQRTWREHTLPAMGYRLGIYDTRSRDSLIEKGIGGRIVEQAGVFPRQQIISDREWDLIRDYYVQQAPHKLTLDSVWNEHGSMPFKARIPDFRLERPAVSAMVYDPVNKQLYVADCSRENHSSIIVLDNSLKPITTLGLPHPVSSMFLRSDTLYVLMMGHFVPSDEPAGQLLRAIRDSEGIFIGYQVVARGLKRPVDVEYGDLDGDGDEDFVVAEFGNHTGQVTLFIRDGANSYTRKVLYNAPGATDIVINDLTRDGKDDILVLMAQGDEGLDLYVNKGENNFERSRILSFPPVYGSVSFSLADVNNDGFNDIVYVNGDNADASQILKPYHGVHILVNDHHNKFRESFFFSLSGAYRALVEDFDNDGDDDIAVVSFFPDFIHHPERGFVFLQNISSGSDIRFAGSTVPEAEVGRWITMVKGDFNGDGRNDIILGSFTSMEITGDTLNILREQQWKKSTPLLVLENR